MGIGDSPQGAFAKNSYLASRRVQSLIDGVDRSIDHLQMTKETLLCTDRNLRLAEAEVRDAMIKKMTHGI